MAWPWPLPFPPRLDWLQVEISTRCPASCLYCPRTIFRDRWIDALMDEQVFHRLLPMLRRTRLVYLQGWGEPLTHPKFFEFVRLAKDSACQVGTTTNGMLLNAMRCEEIVKAGLDIVGLSLAGGTGTENDRVRRGASLAGVMTAIETIHAIKQRTGADRPAIHVAYLLLKSGLPTLHLLPGLLRDKGVAQVVISSVDSIGSPSPAQEALLPETAQETLSLRQLLTEIVAAGNEIGLPIHTQLPGLDDQPSFAAHSPRRCSENLQHAAFVGVTGKVSPCVFTNLPLAGNLPRESGHIDRPYRSAVFGTIQTTPFAAIWHSRDYASFRKAHRSGSPPPLCQGCTKLCQ